MYLLTGSVVVDDKKIKHSGTGRISRLEMSTMSLFETRESSGELSLARLFDAPGEAVMAQTGGEGWIVEDRGMDGMNHIWAMKRDKRKVVVRVKDMKRDVFGDGIPVDESKIRFISGRPKKLRRL